ncbi:MAG: HofP DNA utilization family protein [Pantoea sp.]|uniref:HofP DNA utilization family protein n=1 Tax=Pantoea sp. TaxID=69393 RepID=UPI0023951F4C|nr:HofP DNA utilization family protein [Pantoea sp.]MDE1185622.1 HofP DNA utilization family protein [Pantoea sp.]
MRSSVVLLLILYSALAPARDPFQPLAPAICHTVVTSVEGWRLQGIVGTPQRYVAWLRSPQGKSIRLTEQMLLPFSSWRVQQVTSRTLRLHADQSCSAQQITLQIKGGFYATDEGMDTVAAMADRATARQ